LIDQAGGLFGGCVQLAQRGLRLLGLRLPYRKFGLSFDSRYRRAKLMRGISNKALLCGQSVAQAL
jgi:hypothetical protein